MDYYEITKETLLKATTYMPLATKNMLADDIAQRCLVEAPVFERKGIPSLPLPPLYEEMSDLKAIMLADTLYRYYLNVDMKELDADNGFDSYERHDYYNGGHPLNQIERFKGDKDVKNIAFDLLEDWREFRKMVDAKIFNLKARRNDSLARIWDSLAVMGTPENMEAFAKELEEVKHLGEKVEKVKEIESESKGE